MIRILVALVFATGLASSFVVPAEAGSFAQTIRATTLRSGPGVKYPTGAKLEGQVVVDVQRCKFRWCELKSGSVSGWASLDDLTFGDEPRGDFTGPKNEQVSHGTGTICFHTGENYSGTSVCAKTGTVVSDLKLLGHDNAFASVSVKGTISAHVCRDFYFGSWCETIAESQPALSRFLKKQVSSYRVW